MAEEAGAVVDFGDGDEGIVLAEEQPGAVGRVGDAGEGPVLRSFAEAFGAPSGR